MICHPMIAPCSLVKKWWWCLVVGAEGMPLVARMYIDNWAVGAPGDEWMEG